VGRKEKSFLQGGNLMGANIKIESRWKVKELTLRKKGCGNKRVCHGYGAKKVSGGI